jgi:hypothetical protein
LVPGIEKPSRAANLVAGIDELLESFRVYRQLPRPDVRDFDALTELHRKVVRLAIAVGLGAPPEMVEAELRVYNHLPNWQNPNKSAGQEFERKLLALRAAASAACSKETGGKSHGCLGEADAGVHTGQADGWQLIAKVKESAHALLIALENLQCRVASGDEPVAALLDLGRWLAKTSDLVENSQRYWASSDPVISDGYIPCVNTPLLILHVAWRTWWTAQVASTDQVTSQLDSAQALDHLRLEDLSHIERHWSLVRAFFSRLPQFNFREWFVRLHQEFLSVRQRAVDALLAPVLDTTCGGSIHQPVVEEVMRALEALPEGWATMTQEEREKSLRLHRGHKATSADPGGHTVTSADDAAPKRAWTQIDLDAAIQEYKARRVSRYSELVDAVKSASPGAKKAAQKLFGRNAIARALGVKARAMVTKSPVWQEIADELMLVRGKHRCSAQKRIGHDMAMEEKAVATSETPADQAIRNETIGLINKKMSKEAAEATVDKLSRGEISDDQARQIAEKVAEQSQDARSRKVFSES